MPDLGSTTERMRYIGIDGKVFDLPFMPITGRLEFFLGSGFDPTPFDPAYLDHGGWRGVSVIFPQSALVQPTLTYTVGGDPLVPIKGLLDLSQPDPKTLHVDLGPNAAFATLAVLVSTTPPGDNPLAVVGGVTAPIVIDAYTAQFQRDYPNLGGVADAQGQADFGFPLLSDPTLDGVDLHVAVLALDPLTGQALAASTFVYVHLRDLAQCD